MNYTSLERKLNDYERTNNPAVIENVLEVVNDHLSGNCELPDNIFFIKGYLKVVRLIDKKIDGGQVDLSNFGQSSAEFNQDQLMCFYDYAGVGITIAENRTYGKNPGLDQRIKNMIHHFFSDKAIIATKLARMATETKDKIHWWKKAYEDHLSSASRAEETNPKHVAYQTSMAGDVAWKITKLSPRSSQDRVYWAELSYQHNLKGSQELKAYDKKGAALSSVNAGNAGLKLFKLNQGYLDETIAAYITFIKYYEEEFPQELNNLYQQIKDNVLPGLLKLRPKRKKPKRCGKHNSKKSDQPPFIKMYKRKKHRRGGRKRRRRKR